MSSLRERLLRHKRPEETAVPVTPSENPSTDEWSAVGAVMEQSEWGDFVLRRNTYEAEYRHGGSRLGDLANSGDELWRLLAAKEPGTGSAETSGMPHERLLFMDTETTGLGHGAGNVPFMIGIGFYEGDRFTVEQMLIRHPGEEAAMLGYLQNKLKSRPVLISYNGKSFDWPIVKNRYIMNRMPLQAEPAGHIDFLYPSRSLWKHTLPSCRLGHIEEERLGVYRDNDVPGSLAPALYFQYLAERDPEILKGVFVHNELDVLSLAGLAVHFAALLSGKLDWMHAREFGREEWFRLGLWLDKIGMRAQADEALSALAEELLSDIAQRETGEVDACLLPLAQFFKRRRMLSEACLLWKHYIACKGGSRTASLEPYIELSMYYEHKAKEWKPALEYAQLALDLVWRQGALKRSGNRTGAVRREAGSKEAGNEAAELEKRIERLKRKSASSTTSVLSPSVTKPSRKRRPAPGFEQLSMPL
ncbi:ribonuclease H-like domain-containing protein [Paenibacillus naphthalenovorans]|uniref:ribonuclease H-like domain-containing protein n=1 Tax=Paenibacillus naphthalenovorans TaxID=162209 RepID=UPI003D27C48E